MKYFPLIWAGLWRKRTRTVFTMLSIVVAFLLFGLLQGINQGLNTALSNLDVDRLYVSARSNMTDGLPIAYYSRIKAVPGVRAVSHWTYFGGYFRDARHKKEDGAEVNVALRGVGPKVQAVRPELKIIEGRMFQPAVTEVIVGRSAHAQFKGLDIGDRVTTRGATWTVVGVFSTGGDSHESTLMADAETLMSTDQRNDFQSMTVMLDSPNAFRKFKDALSANPGLAVDVSREREYYRRQSETISKVISVVAYVVGGIMAIGAIFSALNTMYSAVSARLREIATLRALGFGSTAMVISVLAEALLLALIGGAIGAALAWLFFNGHTVSTSAGGPAVGHLVFDLSVSPALIVVGITWACAIGLIGGLFPAVRAARLPVATALRAV